MLPHGLFEEFVDDRRYIRAPCTVVKVSEQGVRREPWLTALGGPCDHGLYEQASLEGRTQWSDSLSTVRLTCVWACSLGL